MAEPRILCPVRENLVSHTRPDGRTQGQTRAPSISGREVTESRAWLARPGAADERCYQGMARQERAWAVDEAGGMWNDAVADDVGPRRCTERRTSRESEGQSGERHETDGEQRRPGRVEEKKSLGQRGVEESRDGGQCLGRRKSRETRLGGSCQLRRLLVRCRHRGLEGIVSASRNRAMAADGQRKQSLARWAETELGRMPKQTHRRRAGPMRRSLWVET